MSVIETTTMLAPGDRIRHKKFREITGTIKNYEWCEPGKISFIPYCIAWDNDRLAFEKLGFMFVYGSDETIEKAVTPSSDEEDG